MKLFLTSTSFELEGAAPARSIDIVQFQIFRKLGNGNNTKQMRRSETRGRYLAWLTGEQQGKAKDNQKAKPNRKQATARDNQRQQAKATTKKKKRKRTRSIVDCNELSVSHSQVESVCAYVLVCGMYVCLSGCMNVRMYVCMYVCTGMDVRMSVCGMHSWYSHLGLPWIVNNGLYLWQCFGSENHKETASGV